MSIDDEDPDIDDSNELSADDEVLIVIAFSVGLGLSTPAQPSPVNDGATYYRHILQLISAECEESGGA